MATVLIVEDDTLSQKILAKMLSNAGHETLSADTIEKAWTELRYHVIVDLIILDNQLRHEWGWQFLRDLKKNPIYQGVPVVVYTAHTERSSLLKYVELGVQGMLVKPYVAQTVLGEVAKAMKTGWASRLMESPQAACERLKIDEADYSSFLHTASSVLGRSVREAKRLYSTQGIKHLQPIVERIKSEAVQLGSPLFKTLITATEEAVANRDPTAVDNCLTTMDAALGLVRQRAMTCVGLGDAIRHSPAVVEKQEARPPAPVFVPPTNEDAAFHRKIAGQPIWNFGRHFGRLRGGRLFNTAEIEKLATKLFSVAPLNAFFSAIQIVAHVPDLPVDDTVHAITNVRGFDAVYLRIASQLGFYAENTSAEENVRDAIRHQGTAKAVSLVAANRIAAAGQVISPLDLRPLLEHTMTVSLLSFEIGRLLQLEDAHNLSAAGGIHDIGKWFFAIGEPAFYGAALSLTLAEGLSLSQAETDIFGLSHSEAGELLLRIGGATPLLRETALHHNHPEKVADRRHAPLVAIVHLADHVARAMNARDEAFAADIRARLLSPTHTIWSILKKSGIELPLDIPDLVDAVYSIADTSAWTATVLLKGP